MPITLWPITETWISNDIPCTKSELPAQLLLVMLEKKRDLNLRDCHFLGKDTKSFSGHSHPSCLSSLPFSCCFVSSLLMLFYHCVALSVASLSFSSSITEVGTPTDFIFLILLLRWEWHSERPREGREKKEEAIKRSFKQRRKTVGEQAIFPPSRCLISAGGPGSRNRALLVSLCSFYLRTSKSAVIWIK